MPSRTSAARANGCVTYAAATRATFRAVIAIDAPVTLGDHWLAQKLIARAAPAPVPLRYVSMEARFGWSDASWRTLEATAPKSWMVYRESLRREGHETLYMLAAYLGLREVFSDYSRLAVQQHAVADILPYYAALSSAFGADLLPPETLLLGVVDDLLAEGRAAGAKGAYDMLVRGYGAPSDGAQLRAALTEAALRPKPTETVASLLATPFPSPADASRFLGDWVGNHWMNPAEPRDRRETLRLRVEAGRVVCELLNSAAPPAMQSRRADYLRVADRGLTNGFLNGMSPRGVILWEGTLVGDTLSGTQRWSGVASPPLPEGMAPGFRFTRLRE